MGLGPAAYRNPVGVAELADALVGPTLRLSGEGSNSGVQPRCNLAGADALGGESLDLSDHPLLVGLAG
jgi:hypothetical protein